MSTPGHCNHCRRYCQGHAEENVLAWTILAQRHRDTADVAEWDDGNCPACAVADLIDAERQTITPSDSGDFQHGVILGLTEAAAIARGDS